MKLPSLILVLTITAGQLVKVPIGSGGATLIDFAVIIFCLIGLFRIKLRLFKPPPFILTGLLFTTISLLSLILTPLHLNLREYLSSSLYIVRFSSYIFLGWLLLSKALPVIKNDTNQILLMSGVSLSILGLIQFIFFPDLSLLSVSGWDPHYYRTVSTFFDPNFTGAFFVLTLLVASQKQPFTTKLKVFILTLLFTALLTTFSRSSYLMFLISFTTYAFIRKSIKIFAVTVIAFLILIGSFYVYTQVISKPKGVDRAKSASLRLDTWQQGFAIFQKNPVLGVGFNAYKFALDEYGLADDAFLNSHGATSNDSSLLFVLSTTGLIGFFSYLFFLLNTFVAKQRNLVLVSAISGLIAHSFFANSLFYPPILLWILLMVA